MASSFQSADDLYAKYTEILAMRLAHADGSENGADVRGRMAALSLRFPGALRELDRLELAEVRARIAKLQSVRMGDGAVEPWMIAVALFHRLTRGALCAKRWVRDASFGLSSGEIQAGAALEDAFDAALPSFSFPDDAREWRHELHGLAAPPGGRVTGLVYARIAQTLGIDASEARRLVFGTTCSAGG